MLKLNLGSEDNALLGWENLDNRPFPGIKPWSWGERLPYSDGSSKLVLVQHSLMYVSKENYNKNFQEIYRVLCVGGVLLIKEENNLKYQWRKLGTKHSTGHIIGSTNLQELVPILEYNKFKVISTDSKAIVEKYNKEQKIINRLPKLFRNNLFVVELEK